MLLPTPLYLMVTVTSKLNRCPLFIRAVHPKDYERTVQTSETLIEVAMCCLLMVRLARSTWYGPHTL